MKGKLGKVVNWIKYNLNWGLHYYLYRKQRTAWMPVKFKV